MRLPKQIFRSCALRISSNRNMQLWQQKTQLFRISCNCLCNQWPSSPHGCANQYATATATTVQPGVQLLAPKQCVGVAVPLTYQRTKQDERFSKEQQIHCPTESRCSYSICNIGEYEKDSEGCRDTPDNDYFLAETGLVA